MRSLASALALTALLAACDKKSDPTPPPTPMPSTTASAPEEKRAFEPSQLLVFAPLPEKVERADNPLTDDKVALGQKLYFDARLSKGQDVSCNSCHDVTKSGADGEPVSIGTHKTKGTRNAPTTFDAAGGSAQGWDGQSPTVEQFILPHAAAASVFDADEARLVDMVSSISAYVAAFKKAFPDEKAITGADISKAIAAYTRRLLTPSPWDKFLGGDQSALTDEQKAGLGAFLDGNCTSCHSGKYLGAAQNMKLGLAKPWPTSTDEGRFLVTKQDVDKFVFKVPTLRNVTKTGPYLHDGSVASLDEIVKLMARHQVGKELTDAQATSIVAFLGALSGDVPKDLAKKPDLPPPGPKTKRPE